VDADGEGLCEDSTLSRQGRGDAVHKCRRRKDDACGHGAREALAKYS
jgi:hypothetical protein